MIWGMAAFLLLLPLVAMGFTEEVNWDTGDFLLLGTMLTVACATYEVAARQTGSITYRAATGMAVVAAFILIWINLAVGLIGAEDDPANLMYAGVLAVGILGAVAARFEPLGMAKALSATAFAQVLVGGVALSAGLGSTAPSFPEAIVVLTGVFAVLWLVSAWLFRISAREPGAGAVQ